MRKSLSSIVLATITCAAFLSPASLSSAVACESAASCSSSKRAVRVYVPRVAAHYRKQAAKVAPIEMEAAESYRLAGHGYGSRLGSVVLRVGGLDLECDVLTWSDGEVTFQVPALKLKRAVTGELHLVSWQGRSLSSKPIRLHGIVVETVVPTEPRIESVQPLGQAIIPTETIIQETVIDGTTAPELPISPSVDAPFDLGQGLE